MTIWRGLAAAAILIGAPVLAQDRTETVAGWTIADVGGKPGNDVERTLTLSKKLGDVELSYGPGESGSGASYVLKFEVCGSFTFSTGFQYDDPPATHAQNARAEVAESYSDFAERCKEKYTSQAELMKGFDQALATAEKWLADRPFVYPPDEPETNGNSV